MDDVNATTTAVAKAGAAAIEGMSAVRKVAIILTSLEKESAAAILRNLSPKSVRQLTAEIRNLGEITPGMRDIAYRDFAERLRLGVNPMGGEDVARALLQEVVGDRDEADELLAKALDEHSHAFSSIIKVDGSDLAAILQKEQPAAVAIVLSFMPPQKSAEILPCFDADYRREVITRLAEPRTADPAMVRRIETIFVDKVISLLHTNDYEETNQMGGPAFVAKLMYHFDRTQEEEMLGYIQEKSKELAQDIRERMFTFDDLIRLSDQDIQRLLREVNINSLIIALRGVKEELFDKIANNLSKNARENMEEEMKLMGKVKRKDVEAEQRSIANMVRTLEQAGQITISGGDDGEEDFV